MTGSSSQTQGFTGTPGSRRHWKWIRTAAVICAQYQGQADNERERAGDFRIEGKDKEPGEGDRRCDREEVFHVVSYVRRSYCHSSFASGMGQRAVGRLAHCGPIGGTAISRA